MPLEYTFLAPGSNYSYLVYSSICWTSSAFCLFSNYCSDFDNLAAFSSPMANDFLPSLTLLGLGFGLDHLAKFAHSLIVNKFIKIMNENLD